MRNPATTMQDWMRAVEKRLTRLENRRTIFPADGYGRGLISTTNVVPGAATTLSLAPTTDAVNLTITATTITFETTGWWVVSADFLSSVASPPGLRLFFGVLYQGNTWQRVSLGNSENRATLTILEKYSTGDSISFSSTHFLSSNTNISGTWKAKRIT